jgi:hypothetical protein
MQVIMHIQLHQTKIITVHMVIMHIQLQIQPQMQHHQVLMLQYRLIIHIQPLQQAPMLLIQLHQVLIITAHTQLLLTVMVIILIQPHLVVIHLMEDIHHLELIKSKLKLIL